MSAISDHSSPAHPARTYRRSIPSKTRSPATLPHAPNARSPPIRISCRPPINQDLYRIIRKGMRTDHEAEVNLGIRSRSGMSDSSIGIYDVPPITVSGRREVVEKDPGLTSDSLPGFSYHSTECAEIESSRTSPPKYRERSTKCAIGAAIGRSKEARRTENGRRIRTGLFDDGSAVDRLVPPGGLRTKYPLERPYTIRSKYLRTLTLCSYAASEIELISRCSKNSTIDTRPRTHPSHTSPRSSSLPTHSP